MTAYNYWNERCLQCRKSRYQHRDHTHDTLVKEHGKCPFGDCDGRGWYNPLWFSR